MKLPSVNSLGAREKKALLNEILDFLKAKYLRTDSLESA